MNLPICPSCGFNGGGHYHASGCPNWGSSPSMHQKCGYCHVAIPALGPADHYEELRRIKTKYETAAAKAKGK